MRPSFQESQLKQLGLLIESGSGVAHIAPALSAFLCKLVGAEAGGLSWFSESGTPEGFYQRGSTREAELLFMNRYEELFSGPDEYTPFWSLRNKGDGIIHTGQASQSYLRSNTFNLLVKPSHCHFLLCVLVTLNGVPRLSVCFFREVKNPFSEADAHRVTALIPLLRSAVGKQANALADCGNSHSESGFLLVSRDGERIEMIDEAATGLLTTVKLFHQNISAISELLAPPRFIQQLCEQLRQQNMPSAQTTIDLAGGALVVTAKWLNQASEPNCQAHDIAPDTAPVSKVLVELYFRRSRANEVVQIISGMSLSPLQGRIAMYAAKGGSRIECAAHHQVSSEALKKHLREIYAASSCADWHELAATLRSV